MEDNEDEPEDVRRATPVEEEIRKGEIDEYSGRPTKPLESARRRRHDCEKVVSRKKLKVDKKKVEKSKARCCDTRETKVSPGERKTATIFVYEKKCTLPKIKAIPRHCLTKEEWIDILATPSRKCPSQCPQKLVTRRVRPVSARMAELAQPPKQRLLNTLESRAGTLPTELVDNLIQTIEGEMTLTPEQAEKMFRDKDNHSRKKCREKKKKIKFTSEKYKNLETGKKSSSTSPFDKEAVNCQYLMAESFVKSILDWKCQIPREEFKDIAEVILKRLSLILEYNPLNGEDRKSQQMRLLADVIGSWISGVLFEVAEARRTELEEECERRRREKDEESDEESDEDFSDKDDDDDDDDDEDDDEPRDEEEKKDDERHGEGDGGGKDDQTMREDKDAKDNDENDDKDGKPLEQDGIDDTNVKVEDDEEFQVLRTQMFQEIDEKKTLLKKPEFPEETTKDDSDDKIPEPQKIGDNGLNGPKERKDNDEYSESPEQLEKIETRAKVLETEKILVSSEKNDFDIGKWVNDEISNEIERKRVAKESEPKDYREKSEEIYILKLLEDAKKNTEKETIEIVKNNVPIKVAGTISDGSTVMAELKKTTSDKQEMSEIYARLRDVEKMATDESLTIKRSKISKEEIINIVKSIREAKISMMKMTKFGKLDDSMTKKSSNELIIGPKYSKKTPAVVTFDNIFHTIYNAIENSNENNGDDEIVNLMHRAVYEKFANILQEDKSGPLTELTRYVLEVMSGKIALWLKNILTESQVNIVDKLPNSVVSDELIDGIDWKNFVIDTADDWSDWIRSEIGQVEGMTLGKMLRDDWSNNCTERIDIDDPRWERYYHESFYSVNRNATMKGDGGVVKTVTRQFLEYNEDKDENETERDVRNNGSEGTLAIEDYGNLN